jgi:hypothetical protein
MKRVSFSRTVEDFFRGAGMLLGGTIAIAVGLLAVLFLGAGILAAYRTGVWTYAYSGASLSLITIAVPAAVVFIGKKIRRDR